MTREEMWLQIVTTSPNPPDDCGMEDHVLAAMWGAQYADEILSEFDKRFPTGSAVERKPLETLHNGVANKIFERLRNEGASLEFATRIGAMVQKYEAEVSNREKRLVEKVRDYFLHFTSHGAAKDQFKCCHACQVNYDVLLAALDAYNDLKREEKK